MIGTLLLRFRSTSYPLLLVPTTLLLFFPVLKLPYVVDDVFIFSAIKAAQHQSVWERFRVTLLYCSWADYYRPLCAPFFLLSYRIFGPTPVPLRLLVLLCHIIATAGIYATTRELYRKERVAAIACCLYAFAWIHWTTLSMFTNLGQAAAHAIFWFALWLHIKNQRAELPWRAAISLLPLMTLAVFFKEDVSILPIFALAACLLAKPTRPKQAALSILVLFAWTLAYLLSRFLLLPRPPISSDNFYRFDWHGLFYLKTYALPLKILLLPFLTLAPNRTIQLKFAQSFSAHPILLSAWVFAVVLLTAGLANKLWGRFEEEPPTTATPSILASGTFAAVGFLFGLIPYAFFPDSIGPMDCHRYALSCGALSIGLAGVLLNLVSRFSGRGKSCFYFVLRVGTIWLLSVTALLFRFPEPVLGPFLRLGDMIETQQSVAAVRNALGTVRDGDELIFVGFRPLLYIPQMLQILEDKSIEVGDQSALKKPPLPGHRRWLIEKRPSQTPGAYVDARLVSG